MLEKHVVDQTANVAHRQFLRDFVAMRFENGAPRPKMARHVLDLVQFERRGSDSVTSFAPRQKIGRGRQKSTSPEGSFLRINLRLRRRCESQVPLQDSGVARLA